MPERYGSKKKLREAQQREKRRLAALDRQLEAEKRRSDVPVHPATQPKENRDA